MQNFAKTTAKFILFKSKRKLSNIVKSLGYFSTCK